MSSNNKITISPEWKEYRLVKDNGKYTEYAEIDLKDWEIPTTPYTMSREDFGLYWESTLNYEGTSFKQKLMESQGWTEEQATTQINDRMDKMYQEYVEETTK